MKKLALIGITAVALLSGCGYETGEVVQNGRFIDVGDLGDGYDLLRDKETGCVYIQEHSAHAYPLTPYYGEDGEVVGCGETDFDKSKY